MVQIVVGAERLGIVHRRSLIHRVVALEEVLGGEHGNDVRHGELVNDNGAILDVGLVELEHACEGVHVNVGLHVWCQEQHQLCRLDEHGHILDCLAVVDGAGELQLSGIRTDGGKELLAGGIVGRRGG